MRKISELLEICKRHHELWGGYDKGMCIAALEARHQGKITKEECLKVVDHSRRLVEEIELGACYLFVALELDRTIEPDRSQLKDWWENHISSLKEEGL